MRSSRKFELWQAVFAWIWYTINCLGRNAADAIAKRRDPPRGEDGTTVHWLQTSLPELLHLEYTKHGLARRYPFNFGVSPCSVFVWAVAGLGSMLYGAPL